MVKTSERIFRLRSVPTVSAKLRRFNLSANFRSPSSFESAEQSGAKTNNTINNYI